MIFGFDTGPRARDEFKSSIWSEVATRHGEQAVSLRPDWLPLLQKFSRLLDHSRIADHFCFHKAGL
jgi:hypothetical protein